ncbi:ubiquinol-cytochrome-c reductase complex subunit-domain-containing protein [Xylariaceae sp. FL0662B]|nr:ubiquinol-cytochrome-c reductase complex subunit-domain-containing protein [Xylariaceae sp. FL0662B]
MVFQTPIRRAAQYSSYKSPYGPKYHYQPNIAGFTMRQMAGFTFKTGAFGGVALFAVIYYASGIPRVQQDVLQNIPLIGGWFVKEPVPASDNPF